MLLALVRHHFDLLGHVLPWFYSEWKAGGSMTLSGVSIPSPVRALSYLTIGSGLVRAC